MKSGAFGVALLVFLPVLASAQEATGRLSGTVTDQQGGVLPGAVVTVRLATQSIAELVTGEDGRFTVDVRPGGPYVVIVQMSGFALQEHRDLFVSRGQDVRVDVQLQIAGLMDTVTVTAGAALARDEKRVAPMILDVVSADSVGRFPDSNAAEALRRIPGVSLEIDQGEGRFVVVRGVDASLNNVTLNGQIVGTPAEFGTRGVSMDSVPADLISRLEVVKAVTPDMDANAIGASINIATMGAFDLPGGFLFGTLRSGYNGMSGRAPFNATASYGRGLGAARRWGFVIGGSYSNRRYDTELFRAANGSWTKFNGYFVPQTQGQFLYDIERRRQGINGALEFRPKTGHALAFRVNHNLFQDTEGRQQVEFDFTRGTLSNQTPTSGNFSQGRASREYRDYRQRHLINAAMLVGTHEAGTSLVDWSVGASRGQRKTPFRVDWEFRSSASAFPNRYDVSVPTLPIVTPNDAYFQASAYPFRRVRYRDDIEREDVYSGEVNLKRAADVAGRTGYWKVGAKFVGRDKLQDRTNDNYVPGSPNFTLADYGLGGVGPDDFFRGTFRFGPTLNLQALKDFFDQNPNRFVRDAVSTAQNSLEQDFTASETVYAGYGMVGIDLTSKANVLLGVRVETTRGDYSAKQLVFANGTFTGRFNPVTGSTDYTDVLPGVHVTYSLTPRLIVRAAWTNTLGRPAYADLAPISALDEVQESDGSWIGSLSEGNSGLKPYESMNIDVSLEYYLPSGLLSVAPFYKQIDNPIYDRSTIETNVVYNNKTYSRFSTNRPENADTGHIGGIELNYQQTYAKLPAPFNGLGTNVNFTFVDSSVTIFGRDEEVPFFKQSGQVGNVAVVYQKHGLEAQVSLSYESPSLGSVGLDADADNYGDWYSRWDAKASFPLGVRFLRGVVELRNLSDTARRRYAGVSDRRVQEEIYGRDLYAGIDWRF